MSMSYDRIRIASLTSMKSLTISREGSNNIQRQEEMEMVLE